MELLSSAALALASSWEGEAEPFDLDVGAILGGARLLVAGDDPVATDGLVGHLRAHGALVGVTDGRGRGIDRLGFLDAHALLYDPRRAREPVLRSLLDASARLRGARMLPFYWDDVWPAGASRPSLDVIARSVRAEVALDRELRHMAEARRSFPVPFHRLGPARVLRALAGANGAVLRVVVASENLRAVVELGGDLVVSATTYGTGPTPRHLGVRALAELLALRSGRGHVERHDLARVMTIMAPLSEALAQAEAVARRAEPCSVERTQEHEVDELVALAGAPSRERALEEPPAQWDDETTKKTLPSMPPEAYPDGEAETPARPLAAVRVPKPEPRTSSAPTSSAVPRRAVPSSRSVPASPTAPASAAPPAPAPASAVPRSSAAPSPASPSRMASAPPVSSSPVSSPASSSPARPSRPSSPSGVHPRLTEVPHEVPKAPKVPELAPRRPSDDDTTTRRPIEPDPPLSPAWLPVALARGGSGAPRNGAAPQPRSAPPIGSSPRTSSVPPIGAAPRTSSVPPQAYPASDATAPSRAPLAWSVGLLVCATIALGWLVTTRPRWGVDAAPPQATELTRATTALATHEELATHAGEELVRSRPWASAPGSTGAPAVDETAATAAAQTVTTTTTTTEATTTTAADEAADEDAADEVPADEVPADEVPAVETDAAAEMATPASDATTDATDPAASEASLELGFEPPAPARFTPNDVWSSRSRDRERSDALLARAEAAEGDARHDLLYAAALAHPGNPHVAFQLAREAQAEDDLELAELWARHAIRLRRRRAEYRTLLAEIERAADR